MKRRALRNLLCIALFVIADCMVFVKADAANISKKKLVVNTESFRNCIGDKEQHGLIVLDDNIVDTANEILNMLSTDNLASANYTTDSAEIGSFLRKKNYEATKHVNYILFINTPKSGSKAQRLRAIHFFDKQHVAEFPSGKKGWQSFLGESLKSQLPSKNGAPVGSYTVEVSFLISRNGKVTEVEALNNPGYGAAEEAVRVVSASPDWIAAYQYGRNVTYRQKQKITFNVTK